MSQNVLISCLYFIRLLFNPVIFYRLSPVCFLFLYLSWQSFLQITLVSEHGGHLAFAVCVKNSHEQKCKTRFCFFWHPYMFTAEKKEKNYDDKFAFSFLIFQDCHFGKLRWFQNTSSPNLACVTNAVPCSEITFLVGRLTEKHRNWAPSVFNLRIKESYDDSFLFLFFRDNHCVGYKSCFCCAWNSVKWTTGVCFFWHVCFELVGHKNELWSKLAKWSFFLSTCLH